MSAETKLKKYSASVMSDVLGYFGIPANTAMNIYQDVMDQRAQKAFEILMSEIRQGHFERQNEHDVVSVCARYQRDAMEGVARNNLRLLARIINGMAENNELKAPSFSRYANVLASLTEKEIRILGVMASYNLEDAEKENQRHEALMDVTTQAEGHLQALMRTGLINVNFPSMWDDVKEGTFRYHTTKLMDEILRYADFIVFEEESEDAD